MPTGGTYILILDIHQNINPLVGSIGTHAIDHGIATYVGSAWGSGGFTRLDRHQRVAAGVNETRHWHIDYLLGHDAVTIRGDRRFPGMDIECTISDRLDGKPIPGFGCTDCDCHSHLYGYPSIDDLDPVLDRLETTYRDGG